MNIAAASITLSQAKLAQQANISILKMAQENAAQHSQDMIRMIAPHPSLGKHLDIKV